MRQSYKSRLNLASFLALSAALYATTGSAMAAPRVTPQYLQVARMILEANIKAETALYDNMESVASYLDRYVHVLGKLPDNLGEIEAFRYGASAEMAANPFKADVKADGADGGRQGVPVPSEAANPGHEGDVQMLVDYELSENTIERLLSSPPDAWRQDPGTVCVVTNGANLALVFGAGSNRLPIREVDSGKPRVIVFKIN